jgi:hypothetical protein
MSQAWIVADGSNIGETGFLLIFPAGVWMRMKRRNNDRSVSLPVCVLRDKNLPVLPFGQRSTVKPPDGLASTKPPSS